MIQPLVSVIVPCYQAERTIVGAVRSALAQTYERLEVIVVDDGSTDGSVAMLAAIADERLHVLQQPNGGTASARNRALAAARGEYIAFLDADDRWLPMRLESDLAVVERAGDPKCIVYGWFYAVDDRGRFLNESQSASYQGLIFDEFIESENFLLPSVSLFHRDIFEAVGGFDPQHFHEDHEFALRATKRFPAYPTRQRLTVYRQAMDGKCRRILSDYATAYSEEMSIVQSLAPLLDDAQRARFRQNQVRSLLYRFLMYGFDGSAKKLLAEVDLGRLRGPKGMLARVYASTGINVFPAVRSAVQNYNTSARRDHWQRLLEREGLTLGYEDASRAVTYS